MPLNERFLAVLVLELIPNPKNKVRGSSSPPVCELGAQRCHQRVPFWGGRGGPVGCASPSARRRPPARVCVWSRPGKAWLIILIFLLSFYLPFFPFPFQSSKKPKTAEADTSSELAKKSKEVFRKEVSFPRAPGGRRASR